MGLVATDFSGGQRPLLVCGSAAWNGLADSPHRTWAFRRAELCAYHETPFRCLNGFRATMGHIRTLPVKSTGVDRLIAVGTRLLDELIPSVRRVANRVALICGAPERMGERGPRGRYLAQRRTLERALYGHLEREGFGEVIVRMETRGHAALAHCILNAAELLEANLVDAVVVGGLDTAYDPDWVETLVREHRIFDGENLDTCIPGEGGAMLLLVPERAHHGAIPALGRVLGAAANEEAATFYNDVPCTATGLSRALRAAIAPLRKQGRKLDLFFTDVSTEQLRTQELQLAFPRLSVDMSPASRLEAFSPLIGDLGAASMPTGMVLGLEAFRRGDPPGASALVSGTSHGEDRGAVCFDRI